MMGCPAPRKSLWHREDLKQLGIMNWGNYCCKGRAFNKKYFQFILMYLFCCSEMYSCSASDCSVVLWKKLVWWPQPWMLFGLWQEAGEQSRNWHDTVNSYSETKLANIYRVQWQMLGAQGIVDFGCNGWQEKSTTSLQGILYCHTRNSVLRMKQ